MYLGFDCSTQSLKVSAVDDALNVVFTDSINFDSDLPSYGTSGGVHKKKGKKVTSPTIMWVDGLDHLLKKMQKSKFPFERVKALSGSGQQHGSVYWTRGASVTLSSLDASDTLKNQLGKSFAIEDSPVWMDSSTSFECDSLEKALGGPQETAKITGSSAYERFTGPQIAKLSTSDASNFAHCDRVSLVSSFFASIFAGKYASIDYSDGSGMNLMDITTRKWSEKALDACLSSNDLGSLLGNVVASHEIVGPISDYFSKAYGFAVDCDVVAWSGDNPCTVAGLGLTNPGDLAISLGTSDTVFGITKSPKPRVDGHVFASPVDPSSAMAMLCFKNGSLVRESVRDRCAKGSWDHFAKSLETTSPGNGNRIGIYLLDPEITPRGLSETGSFYFDADMSTGEIRSIDSLSEDEEVRAVLEGHFLSMRLHAERLGLKDFRRIVAAGGASENSAIVQVIADVFGVPVFSIRQSDAASLGAAYRALHGYVCKREIQFIPFQDILGKSIEYRLRAKPDQHAQRRYEELLPSYEKCEAGLIRRAPSGP